MVRRTTGPAQPPGPGNSLVFMATSDHRITLLGKPGCHLCDDARAVVAKVAAEFGVPWEERDITLSPEEQAEYWEMIPVVFLDGVQHGYWRIDEARLRAALTELLAADGSAGSGA